MVDNIYSKHSHFSLLLSIVLSIDCNYDYTMDYMENVARNFTKKYPSYLIHKKSEDKIKAFLTDRVKAKVETFVNAEAKNVAVTEVREIADLIAEYEGAESSSSFGSHPTDSPSLGNTGVELAMRCGHRRIGHPSCQCCQTHGGNRKTQDNETKCHPCNYGTGSADGNQTILAIPATDSGPVQPA